MTFETIAQWDWSLILQVIGITLGLLYLWLEYRANINLWVVGIIMPVVHGALYFHKGLYADAAMNLYYILAGLYGLIVWRSAAKKREEKSHNKKEDGAIKHISPKLLLQLTGVYAILHIALYYALTTFTDSDVPFWDSFTTAISMVAMWMLSRKYVEQWLAWLIVDVVCVALYFHKEIPFTASLYAIYSILAIVGYLRWRKMAAIKTK